MHPNRFEVGFATRARQRRHAVRAMQGLPVTTPAPKPKPVKAATEDWLLVEFAKPGLLFAPLFGAGAKPLRFPNIRMQQLRRRDILDEVIGTQQPKVARPVVQPVEPIKPVRPRQTGRPITTAPLFTPAVALDGAVRNGMVKRFMAEGHTFLGSGCFGTVLQDKDNPDAVIKVGEYSSGEDYEEGAECMPKDGWLTYIADFHSHPSPHRPVVHSVELHRNCYVARMEKLREQSGAGPRIGIWELREAKGSLADLFHDIRKLYDGDRRVDLHPGNVMLRGDVPVITDPII